MDITGSLLPLKVFGGNVSDVIHCSLQTIFEEFSSKVGSFKAIRFEISSQQRVRSWY